jgi:large subunit ribosomal protein L22
MEVRAITKYVKISPFKAREVTREIQGLPASAALDILKFSPKKAARLVDKTLKSAIANAENNADLRAASLFVKEAVIGEGPTMKRFQPKARGSAGPIRKRTSHIRIILTDDQPVVKEKKNGKKRAEKTDSNEAVTSAEAKKKPARATRTKKKKD